MKRCEDCCLPILDDAKVVEEQKDRCESCEMLKENDQDLSVSPLTEDDLELVMAWRSNPKIYAHFREQNEPLDWEGHVSWFNSRDSDRYDFVLHFRSRRVGVVSIDSNNEVGIYIGDFSAHGRGIATSALNWLCARFQQRTPLFAEIHQENDASIQLFKRCGFEKISSDGDWLEYKYRP